MILAMDSVAFYHLVTGIMILSANPCLDFFYENIFTIPSRNQALAGDLM
jgi:hypothetical protein